MPSRFGACHSEWRRSSGARTVTPFEAVTDSVAIRRSAPRRRSSCSPSSHDRDSVAAAFAAWRNALAPRAVVAFHDYGHPDYPGVREAVRQLELSGEERGGLFVWRAP